jgi:hypothetical protein
VTIGQKSPKPLPKETKMKKLFATFAAAGLAAAFPHAAHAMECCKDGGCECCKKEDGTAEPAPEGPQQH